MHNGNDKQHIKNYVPFEKNKGYSSSFLWNTYKQVKEIVSKKKSYAINVPKLREISS